ncbi:MAG: exostosin family protein [Actinomycetota bacterium]
MARPEFQQPLEIWIKEDLILPNYRPNILLMHLTPRETEPELQYWNLLRDVLPGLVKIHKFKDLAEAGPLVVIPNHFKDYMDDRSFERVREFNQKVLASGRTLVTFTKGLEYKTSPGEIVFAASTYRSSQETSIPTPYWLFDINNEVSPIPKPPIPTVGFVGHTEYPGKFNAIMRYLPVTNDFVGWIAGYLPINRNLKLGQRRVIARWVRKRAIKALRSAKNIQASVIERTGDFFTLPPEAKQRQRAEYLQSIHNNAYTLIMRGDDNSCFQLWEVISAGRLPVIIDTNQLLPDLGDRKWEEFTVFVPFKELDRLGEIVQAFHEKMSEEDFAEACRKSRAAFEYFMPHNFLLTVVRELSKASPKTAA